ncbi:MAG: hypothetical protein ACREX3_07570 [Gammaproteobacteria bacterium]
MNIGSVGPFCIAYATIAVAPRVFLGWIPDRLGTRRMLGIAMSFYALGFTVLSAAQTPVHVVGRGNVVGKRDSRETRLSRWSHPTTPFCPKTRSTWIHKPFYRD